MGKHIEKILTALNDFLVDIISAVVKMLLELSFGLVDDVLLIATDGVSKTPEGWNSEIFRLMQELANNVMVPIGGIILALIIVYEFITAIMEKNNLRDFDTGIFIRFIFKACLGIYFLSHTFEIVIALFDVGNYIVGRSAGVIEGGESLRSVWASVDFSGLDLGTLICLFFAAILLILISEAIVICVYVIVFGRMIEIYMYCAVAPIPMATITNRDFGDTGKNYLKALFALVLQGFFIMVCLGIYTRLVSNIITEIALVTSGAMDNSFTIFTAIIQSIVYGIIMCFMMFKTGSISKSILNVH